MWYGTSLKNAVRILWVTRKGNIEFSTIEIISQFLLIHLRVGNAPQKEIYRGKIIPYFVYSYDYGSSYKKEFNELKSYDIVEQIHINSPRGVHVLKSLLQRIQWGTYDVKFTRFQIMKFLNIQIAELRNDTIIK